MFKTIKVYSKEIKGRFGKFYSLAWKSEKTGEFFNVKLAKDARGAVSGTGYFNITFDPDNSFIADGKSYVDKNGVEQEGNRELVITVVESVAVAPYDHSELDSLI